jgi:hypothetical protein
VFKQGRKPCLVFERREDYVRFCERMRRSGYVPHKGPRVRRDAEIAAWKRRYGKKARHQVHVQVSKSGKKRHVHAHTEPAGYGPRHWWSALMDKANFANGARVLKRDLKKSPKRKKAGR